MLVLLLPGLADMCRMRHVTFLGGRRHRGCSRAAGGLEAARENGRLVVLLVVVVVVVVGARVRQVVLLFRAVNNEELIADLCVAWSYLLDAYEYVKI